MLLSKCCRILGLRLSSIIDKSTATPQVDNSLHPLDEPFRWQRDSSLRYDIVACTISCCQDTPERGTMTS